MSQSHMKPGVAFWVTLMAIVALLAYPLSFGPLCWACSRNWVSGETVSVVYQPILQLSGTDPRLLLKADIARTLPRAIRWYARVGAENGMWYIVEREDGVCRWEYVLPVE